MNYAEKLRRKLTTDCTDPVYAVIYARVSTDNEGQKESCLNQVELAKNFIALHPNIELKGIYIDDGISGKNDFTRPQYNDMLSQISTGSIDLIITKALSRLNRDELNSLMLKNLLLQQETTVYTLEDNQIHDFEDINSGLLHSLSFAMDAQYVQRQSINGRKTHELRCERKELSAKDISFGYDWNRENKSIIINQEQAEIVNKIFEDYVYRNGTPSSIQRWLKSEGIKVSSRTVLNIIQDERYIGKFYINKRTSKLGTGQTKSKRIPLPKEKWVLVERPDLQIIDNDLFNMAQRIHKIRITTYDRPDKKATQSYFQGKHLYSGKIFCSVCGRPYHFGYADRKKTIGVYRIPLHSECSNPVNRINESDLEEITRQALKRTLNQQNEVFTSLETILTECVESSRSNWNEIDKLHKQITSREKQIDSLIDTLSEGGLSEASKERIKSKINTITSEIDHLTESIRSKEANKLSDSYVSDKIAEIKAAIEELRNFTVIDRWRVLNYIERIELSSNGDIDLLLKSARIVTIQKQEESSYEDGTVDEKTRIQDAQYSSN